MRALILSTSIAREYEYRVVESFRYTNPMLSCPDYCGDIIAQDVLLMSCVFIDKYVFNLVDEGRNAMKDV